MKSFFLLFKTEGDLLGVPQTWLSFSSNFFCFFVVDTHIRGVTKAFQQLRHFDDSTDLPKIQYCWHSETSGRKQSKRFLYIAYNTHRCRNSWTTECDLWRQLQNFCFFFSSFFAILKRILNLMYNWKESI